MIIEVTFGLFFELLKLLFELIPNLDNFAIPSDLASLFTDLVRSVGFFLPLGDFALMFSIFMLIINFRFFSNIFHRIWDMLPLT